MKAAQFAATMADAIPELTRQRDEARAKVSELAVKLAEARRRPGDMTATQRDATTQRDANQVNAHIESAKRWLWHSMEAQSSMLRIHCCRQAALDLFNATALSDGKQRCILAAHFRQADALAGQFWGDGIGTQRLLDELGGKTSCEQSTIFRDHRCYRCRDGEKPCVRGNPNSCDYLHTRND